MVDYADKKVGWLLYPVLGISFIFFANDNDIETLVHLPSFKWDVVFSLSAVSLVGLYLAWVTRRLDKNQKSSWRTSLRKRFLLQFFYGIVIPLFFSIGLELLYLLWIKFEISQSSILNLELPLAFIYLLFINLLYYLNYISHSQRTKNSEHLETSLLKRKVSFTEGAKESLMPIENIAFIRSSEKLLWVHTFQARQSLLSGTLNDWENELPNQHFYRINRQFIVHRDAIKNIESTETRRLKVLLGNYNGDVYVPKTKATEFRRWLQA